MIGWGAGENTFQHENLRRSGLTQNFGKWQHSPFVLSVSQYEQGSPLRLGSGQASALLKLGSVETVAA